MGKNAQRRRAGKSDRMATVAMKQLERESEKVNAYQSGFLDGYLRCVEDISTQATVTRVATRIVAVMHDNVDMARYVVGIVQNVVRPTNAHDLVDAMKEMTAQWVARQEARTAPQDSEAAGPLVWK